jgi:prepilin-type N-terminal cleavage/methylation domain-containing protein
MMPMILPTKSLWLKPVQTGSGTIRSSHGFTLVELLVAIALLMIIMVGAGTVFRSTSQTIGSGQALMDSTRRLMAARSVLQTDLIGSNNDPFPNSSGLRPLRTPAPDRPPFLMIRQEVRAAYADKNQWNEGVPANNYRTDMLGFFAQGVYKRQTGGDAVGNATFSDMTETNAYVWYGHLLLPDGPAVSNMRQPGWTAGTPLTDNPYNYFANQWVLGRVAMLMATPVAFGVYPHGVPDVHGNPVWYIGRNPTDSVTPGLTAVLTPLQANSVNTLGNGAYPVVSPNNFTLQHSRYDIMGTYTGWSWDDYAQLVADQSAWCFANNVPWVDRHLNRFQANPFADMLWNNPPTPADRALFAQKAAQTVPLFLSGCTNFIVEFAGDYVEQNALGYVLTPANYSGPFLPGTPHLDGVIDYRVVGGRREIQWYGLPRDVDGDGSDDVIRVQDIRKNGAGISQILPFETLAAPGIYSCGWTANEFNMPGGTLAPRLIRITVQLADPEGRLPEGVRQEYIFPVRHY